MGLIQIKRAVRVLSLKQLRRLDEWLHEFIEKAEESARADRLRSREQVVEERTVDNLTYRLEGVRCGKEKCKCKAGKLHGPYWYSYSRIEGGVRSKYVGKKLTPEIERRLHGREGK